MEKTLKILSVDRSPRRTLSRKICERFVRNIKDRLLPPLKLSFEWFAKNFEQISGRDRSAYRTRLRKKEKNFACNLEDGPIDYAYPLPSQLLTFYKKTNFKNLERGPIDSANADFGGFANDLKEILGTVSSRRWNVYSRDLQKCWANPGNRPIRDIWTRFWIKWKNSVSNLEHRPIDSAYPFPM